MSEIRQSVKIGPIWYRLAMDGDAIAAEAREHALEGGTFTAFSDHERLIICLNPKNDPGALRIAFLHEVLHCCLRQSGIWVDQYAKVVGRAKGKHGGYTVEEATVTGITATLLGVLRDNPDLLAWLLEVSE